jgi:hypothetical protein
MCMGRELESQIIQFAAGLQSLGLGKGDKVRYGGSCAQ